MAEKLNNTTRGGTTFISVNRLMCEASELAPPQEKSVNFPTTLDYFSKLEIGSGQNIHFLNSNHNDCPPPLPPPKRIQG